MKRAAWIKSLFFLVVLSPCLLAAVKFTLADRSKAYYGNSDKIANPTTVEIQKVYDQLPSYQEAMKQPDGSAKRVLGLKKASDEFRDIVAKVCKEKKYEFAAEKGYLSGEDSTTKKPIEIPDITQDAIKAIPAK